MPDEVVGTGRGRRSGARPGAPLFFGGGRDALSLALVFEQLLNGLQYGVMLFLMAAGLTLVFGIMNMVNLAHGSLYMVGAYLAAALTGGPATSCSASRSRLPARCWSACVVEIVALRALYQRDHLDQVLATFGLILFFNELVA